MHGRTMTFCAAAAVAGIFLLTCSTTDNPPTSPEGVRATWTYTVDGNDLIISHPADTSTRCADTGLVTGFDSAYTDTNWFILSSNNDTLWTEGEFTGDTNTLVRNGTGTGIQGQWLMNRGGYDITVEVGSSTITASMCFADLFMGTYGRAIDSLDLNITVNQGSCSSVLLTGNVTHEQVTIIYTQSGNSLDNLDADVTFQSDNPQHAQSTVYANPASCPNKAPDWLTLFFFSNW